MACIHFWLSFVLLSLVALSLLLPIGDAKSSNETDRQALLEIKTKISDDPLGVLSSWNNSIHFCQWSGVTCGRKHQRVTVLDLHSRKLGGAISPFIGNLSFLWVLDLKNNTFRDEIPAEIGHLRRLQILYLYNNSLSGEIPSNISRCSSLISLSFTNNKLVGEIPVEMGSFLKLQFLALAKNNLSGSIPPSLGNLSSLDTLSLALNNLDGKIPDALGKLRKLTFLGLSGNRLTGSVPSSIFNLSSITLMDIGYNQLQGHLPPDLFISLPNLHDFAVALNQFTGSIPPSLSNASTSLGTLQVQGNSLTGRVPDLKRLNSLSYILIGANSLGRVGFDDLDFLCSLTNASDLFMVEMTNNNFGGPLPECIVNLSSRLGELSFSHNQISGTIPGGLGNLIGLAVFQGWNNSLSGIIPQTIGNLQNLQILFLDENKFSGGIPSSLGNLTNLYRLHLADNDLEGEIPPSLGGCKSLQFLDLSRNNLTGSLPAQVIGLSSISLYLGFAQNHLTGSLPMEIGALINLGILDVSGNKLSGKIPGELGSCVMLERLYMQGNLFQGPIPSTFRSLRGLLVMDLSNNNLSGQIPDFLTSFSSLFYLNLSFNELEGMVPTGGVFNKINTSIILVPGNKKLCGGIPEFHLPVCNFLRSNNKRSSEKTKVIISVVSGLLGVSLILVLVALVRFKKKREKLNSSNSVNSFPKVSYGDLYKATGGFSPENLLGVGSFGSVYKGILNGGGQTIAVKVLNLRHHGAIKGFVAECEALRNIRHRNLVKILTACSSIDYQGNDFKALVFEFMENGSLEEWLHPPIQDDATHVAVAQKNLTLSQRLKIAIHVASAIEYLHSQCETPIVHCDLKPSNVLLDNELIGHVSDFGLAKFLSKDIQNLSANQSSSIGVRGTVGYAPPEYGLGSEVSTAGDVYSFGIMLLEMFTGKRPTDELFKEEWNLHKLAKTSLSSGVATIIDSVLLEEIGELEMGTDEDLNTNELGDRNAIKCLNSIVEIGVACSSYSPGERMNIGEVARRLSSIQDKLLG